MILYSWCDPLFRVGVCRLIPGNGIPASNAARRRKSKSEQCINSLIKMKEIISACCRVGLSILASGGGGGEQTEHYGVEGPPPPPVSNHKQK